MWLMKSATATASGTAITIASVAARRSEDERRDEGDQALALGQLGRASLSTPAPPRSRRKIATPARMTRTATPAMTLTLEKIRSPGRRLPPSRGDGSRPAFRCGGSDAALLRSVRAACDHGGPAVPAGAPCADPRPTRPPTADGRRLPAPAGRRSLAVRRAPSRPSFAAASWPSGLTMRVPHEPADDLAPGRRRRRRVQVDRGTRTRIERVRARAAVDVRLDVDTRTRTDRRRRPSDSFETRRPSFAALLRRRRDVGVADLDLRHRRGRRPGSQSA